MAIRTDEATLKKLAHNAQPILAAAGLELGHKQCLELVARMHGHENYESAKASFGVQEGTRDASGKAGASTAGSRGRGSAEDQERRRQQEAFTARVGSEFQERPEEVIGLMCSAVLAALAKRFPPQLSAKDRKAIKENYPEATDDLIEERAMNDDGVMVVLVASELMARIGVDYSASSAFKQDMAKDDEVASTAGKRLQMSLSKSLQEAVDAGMTPFGAMTTSVLMGALFGRTAGLAPAKISRALLDGMKMAVEGGPRRSQAEVEEAAIQGLMKLMGISRTEAKRYAKMAAEMQASGKL